VQPVEAALCEATAPAAHRREVATQLGCDLGARATFRRRQHDPAAKRQRLRALRPSYPPLEDLTLLMIEHDLCALGHRRPPIVAVADDDFAADPRVPAD